MAAKVTGDVLNISGWARKLSPQGVVYYVKRGTNETSWLHPGLSSLLSSLGQFDNIRYAAYRLSSKLLAVQSALATNFIPLPLAQSVLAHHGLANQPDVVLDSHDLREFLHDLYIRACRARGQFIASYGFGGPDGRQQGNTEMLANFVEQILDPDHSGGCVTVLGLKTVLSVLTRARLRDRLAVLFRDHSDHQAKLGDVGLRRLLYMLSRIPELLGEGVMFGGSSTIERGVTSCLSRGGGRVVTEEVWMSWASREPPELVWLTTSYRQQAANKIQHTIRCSACSVYPIMGLRYQCLQCLSYDLCQQCFFTGVSSRGHKAAHPVQEYCYPSTRKEEAKAFFVTLVNKIRQKKQVAGARKPRKKIKRYLKAEQFPPNEPPTKEPKSSKMSWSQMLGVRNSPIRTNNTNSEDQQSEKTSRASSGFCSGEDNNDPPSKTSSAISGPESSIYENINEIESPNLEWDDEVGVNLGDSRRQLENKVEDLEIMRNLDNFENSIFRKDQETGDLLCYQHNTKGHDSSNQEAEYAQVKHGRGQKGIKRNKSKHENKSQMASIIFHLENDHLQLERQLSTASPDLVKPVMEAQGQINRLKELMKDMFASNTLLDNSETSELVNNDDQERVIEEVERIAESTRLDTRQIGQTPLTKFRENDLDIFSPIVTVSDIHTVNKKENKFSLETSISSNQSDYLQLVQLEDEEVPLNKQEESESKISSDNSSLTEYNLDDLSQRLGGTELYISRDNGLDITNQLDDTVGDKSRYVDTMDQLEKLMGRLSDVFDSFRNPPDDLKPVVESKELVDLVDGLNENLVRELAKAKESII